MTFGIPSLPERPGPRPTDKAEPRLFPEAALRPFGDAATADAVTLSAGTLSTSAPEGRVPVTLPTLSAQDGPLARAAAGFPAGALLYLALAGLVAVLTIGAFFSAGFLLRAAPKEATSAAAVPNPAHPPVPISHEPALPPHPATAAALSGPSPMPHPSASKAAPLPPVKTAQGVPPPSAGTKPPPQIASQPSPRPPGLAVPAAQMATSTPSSHVHTAPRHIAGSRLPHPRRVAHARSEARRSPVRSVRSDRSPAAVRPRVARSAAPSEAGQTHAFDQLLTQLTGPTKPAGEASAPPASTSPSLTPPEAGRPDHFARHAGTDRGGPAPLQ